MSLRPHPRAPTPCGELARFGAAGDGSVRDAEARTWRVRALILGAPSRRERAAARGTGARAAVAAATAARENDMERLSPHREPRKVPSDRTRRVAREVRSEKIRSRVVRTSRPRSKRRRRRSEESRDGVRSGQCATSGRRLVQKPQGNILFLPGKWPGSPRDVTDAHTEIWHFSNGKQSLAPMRERFGIGPRFTIVPAAGDDWSETEDSRDLLGVLKCRPLQTAKAIGRPNATQHTHSHAQ